MAKTKSITETGPKVLKGIRNPDLYPSYSLGLSNSELKNIDDELARSAHADYNASHGHLGYQGLRDQSLYSPQVMQGVDYGSSSYDDGVLVDATQQDIQDQRADLQPWYAQIGAGLAKGAILAGTTFLDGTVGLLVGGATAIGEGRVSGLWDNDFSKAMQSVNEWSEEALPNYYSQNELNQPWYENIFTANFIGDKFIKNLGFSVGALYSGGVASAGLKVTKLPQLIGAITKSAKAPAAVSTLVGATVSAVNEGRIEALNNSKDWQQLKMQELDDQWRSRLDAEYAPYIESLRGEYQAALDEYEATKGKKLQRVGIGDNLAFVDPAYEKYKARLASLDARSQSIQASMDARWNNRESDEVYREVAGKIAEDRLKMGNTDMLLNLPILMASNIVQFTKFYSNGFNTARRAGAGVTATGDIVEGTAKYAGETFSKGKAAFKVAKGALAEGTEEISQKAASLVAGDYYSTDVNNFHKAQIDRDAEQETLSWTKSFANGINETVNDGSSWEEFFIGALTGLMGVPSFRSMKNSEGKFQSPIQLQGGAYNEFREYQEDIARSQEVADYLNQRVQSPEFLNYYRGLIRHNKYQKDMNTAVEEDDEFNFKNAEHAQFVSDIVMFDNAGRLGDLRTFIDSAHDMSDENLQSIVENSTSTDENGRNIGPFVDKEGNPLNATEEGKQQMIDKLTRSKDTMINVLDNYRTTKEDLDTRTGGALSNEQLSEMTWLKTQVDDWSNRAKEMTPLVKRTLSIISDNLESNLITRLGDASMDDNAESIIEAVGTLSNIKGIGSDRIKQLKELSLMNDKDLMSVLTSPRNEKFVEGVIQDIEEFGNDIISGLDKQTVVKLLRDLPKIGKGIETYNNKLEEYLKDPTQLAREQQAATESVAQENAQIAMQNTRNALSSAKSVKELRDVIASLENKDDVEKVLSELSSEDNQIVKNYRDVSQYDTELKGALNSLGVDSQTAQDALSLWQEHFDLAENIGQIANPNSIAINNEEAFMEDSNGDVELAGPRFENARYALQKAMSKVNNDIKFKNRFSEEYRKPVNEPVAAGKGTDKDATGNSGTSTVPHVNPGTASVEVTPAPVGNVTAEMVAAENSDANRRVDTQRTLDQGQSGQRKYYRPAVPELHIEASKEGDFRPFDVVVSEKEPGVNFSGIYNYLRDKGAFDYVNSAQLKAGDELGFMIDPEYGENTIFIVDTKNNQIVGSIDESSNSLARYEGLAELSKRVKEEYQASKSQPTTEDTVGGSPVALSFLLENGPGTIESAGYFLHGVAAAFPAITDIIEHHRNSTDKSVLGMKPDEFVASGNEVIDKIRSLVNEYYGEDGVKVYDKLLSGATGFFLVDGRVIEAEIEKLSPIKEAPKGNVTTESVIASSIKDFKVGDKVTIRFPHYPNSSENTEGTITYVSDTSVGFESKWGVKWGLTDRFLHENDNNDRKMVVSIIKESKPETSKQVSKPSSKKFLSTSKTRVSKIMVGRIPYSSEERSLADIPGVIDSNTEPVFGVIKNGVLTTNGKIDDRLIIKPVDMSQKEGRLYLLIPNAAGTYSPAAVRVKHFNTQEFNIDDATTLSTPMGESISGAITRLSEASSQDDVSIAMKELAQDLYMQDVMVTWFDAKAGSGVVISKKVRKPDGTYEMVNINGQEQIKEDKFSIYFQNSKSVVEYGGMEFTREVAEQSVKEGTLPASIMDLFGQPRDSSDIRKDILNTILKFNLPLQVSTSKINETGYNNRVIKSNILSSNLREAKVIGSWFTTDYFDSQGNLQKAISPSSVAPAPGRRSDSPVRGKESIIQGTRVSIGGNSYIVDLKQSIITDEKTGKKRGFIEGDKILIDLAWAQENFGDRTESSVMTENKIITPKGEVLDRATGKYLTGEEAQRIKDKIAGRNKEKENKIAQAKKIESDIIENQKKVDRTKTDGDYYYILEDDGQYHKYDRVHKRLGSNWIQSEKQVKVLQDIKLKLSQLADNPTQFDNYLDQLATYYKQYSLDLSPFKGKVDAKTRDTIVNIIRDKMAGTNSQRALDAGTAVDNVIRHFFTQDTPPVRPEILSEEAFIGLLTRLTEVKSKMEQLGERFLTNNIVIFQKYQDGTRVAGEVDILSVDSNGNFKIYDVKTSRYSFGNFVDRHGNTVNYFENKSNTQRMSTKDYYTLQLSAYQNLFESQYGIRPSRLAIMPFVLSYSGDKVSTITSEKGIPITYNPAVNVPLLSPTKPVVELGTGSTSSSILSAPIFEPSIETMNPENRVLPENAFEEGGKIGFYELEGKLYSGYLKQIGEVKVTDKNGQELRIPIHVTKVRDRGLGRPGEFGSTSEYLTVFPNGKAISTRTNDINDNHAAEVIIKALSAKPEKVLELSSEKTQIHDPKESKAPDNSIETNQRVSSTQGAASASVQKINSINPHDEEFEDELELRRVDDTRPIWNEEKELSWLSRVLPQLSEQDRVRVVKGLIQVSENGPIAWGMFSNGIITLSDIAAEGTVYHEAFHAVFSLMLNSKERGAILSEAIKKWGRKSYSELMELLAEDFREYVTTQENRGLGRRVLDFFKNLFMKIKNWNNISPSLTAYYQAINTGKYSKRGLNNPITRNGQTVLSLENALRTNLFSRDIISKLSKLGYVLSGSAAYSLQGVVYRQDQDNLHDIDLIESEHTGLNNPLDVLNSLGYSAVKMNSFDGVQTYVVSKHQLHTINNKLTVVSPYGTFYEDAILDRQVKDTVLIDFIQEPIGGVKTHKVVVDGINLTIQDAEQIEEAKLKMSRDKDISDLSNYETGIKKPVIISWKGLNADIRKTLQTKGWTQEHFDRISQVEKDNAIECAGL